MAFKISDSCKEFNIFDTQTERVLKNTYYIQALIDYSNTKLDLTEFETYKEETQKKLDSKTDSLEFEEYISTHNKDFQAVKSDLGTTKEDLKSFKTETKTALDTKVSTDVFNTKTSEIIESVDGVKNDLGQFKTTTQTALDSKTNKTDFEAFKNETTKNLNAKVNKSEYDTFVALNKSELLKRPIKTDVDNALAAKQDKTDNALETTNKTIVGAINEERSRLNNDIMDLQTTKQVLSDLKTNTETEFLNRPLKTEIKICEIVFSQSEFSGRFTFLFYSNNGINSFEHLKNFFNLVNTPQIIVNGLIFDSKAGMQIFPVGISNNQEENTLTLLTIIGKTNAVFRLDLKKESFSSVFSEEIKGA